jgi:serine/threonine-protein kinase
MNLPATLGKYELVEYLGGGMSRVFRARDTVLGRTVAVKILTPAAPTDKEAVARFLREAQTAASITHDNILHVYDYGEAEGSPYMVMEFVRGEDLRAAIKANRTGDVPNRLRIARDAARALQCVHENGIVHRDIKPENVCLTSTGQVKLMDFGIAKAQGLDITRPGFTLGTPYYMAPEQILGQQVTALADVYSFGVMLYELFTGQRLVSGDNVERVFYQALHEVPDLSPMDQAGAPPSVKELVARCIQKRPEDRPQTMAEVAAALEIALREATPPEGFADHAPPAAAPAPAPLPAPAQPAPAVERKSRLPLFIGAGVLAVAAAVAAYIFSRPGVPTQPPDKSAAAAKPPERTLEPVIQTPTGQMVLVPPGAFLSGKDNTARELPAYYIDKTEVTNAAWARFLAATGRTPSAEFSRTLETYPNRPVVNITITEAMEFARWAGKEIPNLAQWEKAARGSDGRLYPWGSSPDGGRANLSGTPASAGSLIDAGSMPEGASPYGALHMLGNAWEFVNELIAPSPAAVANFRSRLSPPPTASEPWYRIVGGSYATPMLEDYLRDWSSIPGRYKDPTIGFRCVRRAD